MKFIYIVSTSSEYGDDYNVRGVFTKIKYASEYVAKYNSTMDPLDYVPDIETYQIDK